MSLGIIINKDGKDSMMNIQTSSSSGETPDQIMSASVFFYSEGDKGKVQSEQLCINSLGSTPLKVDGVDGKLYEITGTVTFNNTEEHGYMAVFIDNGKSYTMSYLTDKDDFETYKDIVKGVISSAKFN